MKIRTKFVTVYKTSDVTLATSVRFSTDSEYSCAFSPRLKISLPLHRINFPCYFTKGRTNYDWFTPCPYS
jgi:hypothetical protein